MFQNLKNIKEGVAVGGGGWGSGSMIVNSPVRSGRETGSRTALSEKTRKVRQRGKNVHQLSGGGGMHEMK